jgi:drug/metabolite transporter (DMT)-like permease
VSKRGWALFLALSVIWGVPYLFIKMAVEHVSPAVLACTRTALAALVLLPIAAAGGQLRPVLARWRWVVPFAVIEIAVPFGLLGTAEQRLSSSLTGLLVAGVPLIGAVIGVVFRLADRIDRRRLLGLLVGFAGVAGLVGIDLRGGDLLAAGAVLLAATGYAIGPVIADRRLADLPSLGVTVVAMGLNGIGYLPWAAATWPSAPVPVSAWVAIAVLGVICSALAFLVAEVGPARTTVITYLNPAVAVALGVSVLDEPLTAGILIGFPLVLLGSWLATRKPRRDPALPALDENDGEPLSEPRSA